MFTFQSLLMTGQIFNFSYQGPDTLFVNGSCEAVLDWGHPEQPQVSSAVGTNIDSFYIHSISGGYEVNELVPPGLYTITYRVVDDIGNEELFSFDIHVVDTLLPVLLVAANTTVSCSFQNIGALLESWYNANGNIQATDNCGVVIVPDLALNEVIELFNQSASQNCGGTRSVTVHFTILDPSNNMLPPVSVTFETVDLESPVFQNLPQPLTAFCAENIDQILEDWIDDAGGASATDNCTDDLLWEVLWTDNANNSGKDTIGNKPYKLMMNREKCQYVVNLNFIAIDGCNNKKSSFTTITITDNNFPLFSSYPGDTTVNVHDIPPPPDISAIDPCKGELIVLLEAYSNKHPDPLVKGHYNYTVEQIWTAGDGCNHSIMHLRDMKVVDTIPPMFTVPADITVSCLNLDDTAETGVPSNVSDLSGSPVEVYFIDKVIGEGCAYNVERHWYAKDISENIDSATQIIQVVDNIPPVVETEAFDMQTDCNDTEAIITRFLDWINAKAGAVVTDQCSEVAWFAAEPGSYTLSDTLTYPGLFPRVDFFNTCVGEDSVMFQKQVDFVFYDDCGNHMSFSRKFQVIDVQLPVFENCPGDTTLTLATDECQLEFTISGLLANDFCGSPVIAQEITQAFMIRSQLPGDQELPVDTTTIRIGPFNLSNLDIDEILELKLDFKNIDANDPNEYFVIRGEDGSDLGRTPVIDEECGDYVVSLKDIIQPELLQIWLADGFLTLVLEPKITTAGGAFSINDICSNESFVEVTLNINLDVEHQLSYALSVDGSQVVPFGPGQTMGVLLSAGTHPVRYFATDCGGNTGVCLRNIIVKDTQAPEIECPESLQLVLTEGCERDVLLPDTVEISDNCFPGTLHTFMQPATLDEALLKFSPLENTASYFAQDKTYIFSGLPADIFARNPRLIVSLQGNTQGSDAFFEILDENGNLLGITAPGSCDSVTTNIIDLNEIVLHQAKNDGAVSFSARAVATSPIHPCDASQVDSDGDNDGKSNMHMSLVFEEIDLAYYVTGATEKNLTSFTGAERPVKIPMKGGTSTVHYVLKDNSGNADTCTFEVIIEDIEKPKAVCKEEIGIFIHPSGLVDYILQPEELDGGSLDNCLIDSMAVMPQLFNCSQAGTTVDVTLFVFDAFNLADSCITSVKVETQPLLPTYTTGVCAKDTLHLYANLPDAPDNTYTIQWSGPDGFMTDELNPSRPDATALFSGTYNLLVTGAGSCRSEGIVDVFIEDLSIPPLNTPEDTVCEGESLILSTNNYSGELTYSWFSGTFPDGLLMGKTSVPDYSFIPDKGIRDYYVIVESSNCISDPSATLSVNVLEQPQASVNTPFIKICEGDDLVLGTSVTGAGFQYNWTGPATYSSHVQNPVIQDVGLVSQGRYTLVISNNLCKDTAFAEVLIDPRPIRPVVSSDTLYCEGEPIVFMVTNIVNADSYHWYLDDQLFTVRNSSSWVIPAASDQVDGKWTVAAKVGDCYSLLSEPVDLSVELAFPVTASSNSPVCQGDSVKLFAPLITDAKYLWIDPNNQTYQDVNPVLPAVNGTYRLELTTAAGCLLTSSTEVEVIELPVITALSNTAEPCMQGDECIEFIPTVFPPNGNYTYLWSGPGGYGSTQPNPVICNPDPSLNGDYTLIVSQQMCPSRPVSTSVELFPVPEMPILEGTSRVCEYDTIVLRIQNYLPGGSNVYFWDTPDNSQFQTTKPELRIPSAALNQSGTYSVKVFNGHCYSEISLVFNVEVIRQPNQPSIWGDEIYCEGDAIRLFTNFVQQGNYIWEGPQSYTSAFQNPIIYPASPQQSGVYRLRVEAGGCFSEYSDGILIEVNPKPEKPNIIGGVEPFCYSPDNDPLELCLTYVRPATSYSWYHNQTGKLILTSVDPCVSMDQFQDFVNGQNGFYVVAESKGCFSDPSELVHVLISVQPDLIADAGDDIFACDDSELKLKAVIQQGGIWSTPATGVNISNAFNPYTEVSGLAEGPTMFIWSLSYEICRNYSTDTAFVHIAETPDAVDDLYQTDYKTNVDLQPALNDVFNLAVTVQFNTLEFPEGIIEKTGINTFRFIPNVNFIGRLKIPYRLILDDCPDKFSEAIITIDVGDITDCFGMNVITPNGDGVNDYLVFPCLSTPLYPANRLIVFNQWGDEVYSASPYLNDWEGTYKGKDLPVGTYYYMLDLGNDTEVIRDFVVIER